MLSALGPTAALIACAIALLAGPRDVGASCPAAGPVDLPRVDAAVNAGRMAQQDGRVAEAIEHYATALAHVDWSAPGWATVGLDLIWSIAELSAGIGRHDAAVTAYRCFLARPERDADRATEAWSRIEQVERAHDRVAPWLVVSSAPLGAAVTLDGAAVGVTPWRGRTTPGRHHIALHHPERVPVERTVEVPAGALTDVPVALVEYARLRIDSADGRWRVRIGDEAPATLPVDRRLAPGPWPVTFEGADGTRWPPRTVELAAGEVRTLEPPRPDEAGPSAALYVVGGGLALTAVALSVAGAARHAAADEIDDTGGSQRDFVDAVDQGNGLYVGAAVAGGLAIGAVTAGWLLNARTPAASASAAGWTLGRF